MCTPFFQHPAQVLAAARGDDALADEVRANLAKLQRPNGSPRVVGAWSARRQMAAICCFDKRGGAPSLRGRLSADRPCRATRGDR